MKRLKKVYCLVYQTIFKLALPILPYRKPQVLKKVDLLSSLFQARQVTRVLLVTDAGIRKLGITQHLEDVLAEKQITCIVYGRTVANPTTANVEEAARLYRQHDCQAIIGFGGGSSMDCAKAVGARIAKPRQSLAKMKGILKIHK